MSYFMVALMALFLISCASQSNSARQLQPAPVADSYFDAMSSRR